MPDTYAGEDVFHDDIYVTDDGDNVAAFVYSAKRLGDRTASLDQSRMARADLGTLRAIDTTGVPDGSVRRVARIGLFVLDKGATDAADEPWIVTPTTGPGRWIGCVPHRTSAVRLVQGAVVSGITSSDVLVANRNVSVDFVPVAVADVSYPDGAARGAYAPSLDASRAFAFPISAHVIDGARLVSVRARFSPSNDHFAVPGYPAAFGVRRLSRTLPAQAEALLSTNSGLANDSAVTLAAVNADRDWSWTADQNNVIDLANYTYDIVAFNEAGFGGRATNGWVSFELTFAGRLPPRALGT